MLQEVETLLEAYEQGKLGRRQFVQALGALVAGTSVAQAGAVPEPTFKANALNHVTVAVADPERSRAFYEATLGCPVVSRQFNGINVGLGDSFLGLYDIPDAVGRIHHFCVGVDGYEIDDAAERLRTAGIEPYVRQDRPEIYFTDPDGITVQLAEKSYRG